MIFSRGGQGSSHQEDDACMKARRNIKIFRDSLYSHLAQENSCLLFNNLVLPEGLLGSGAEGSVVPSALVKLGVVSGETRPQPWGPLDSSWTGKC